MGDGYRDECLRRVRGRWEHLTRAGGFDVIAAMKHLFWSLMIVVVAAGCTTTPKPDQALEEPSADLKTVSEASTVVLATSMGEIVIELDREKAPLTTANFLAYVASGFYDGTVFHRVIDGFMVQGGGFSVSEAGELVRKTTRDPIAAESQNGLKNVRGSVAMARRREANSATSQFFINHADNARLDFPSFDGTGYTVFGRVTSGLEVVDKIATVKTRRVGPMGDVPVEPIVITSVKVK